jgi:Uri superfamily endonuclease
MRAKPSQADSGVYRLWIDVQRAAVVSVGRLGSFRLEPGTYVYVGSARRNLTARLARHRRADKTMRWHIDYVLGLRQAAIRRVETRPWREGAECRWARRTLREGGRIVIAGFGASDCRNGCGAHLFMMDTERADQDTI